MLKKNLVFVKFQHAFKKNNNRIAVVILPSTVAVQISHKKREQFHFHVASHVTFHSVTATESFL